MMVLITERDSTEHISYTKFKMPSGPPMDNKKIVAFLSLDSGNKLR